ncbi:hypothetical protein V491_01454 [Pseudogymnoascus sp. VKM F-3775]|nr:hypothetical protein V491_01454 [Pseudogymnoascus sp. VKM F-3775]
MATQLLQLPEVTRLSSRVIRILGGNPGKVSASVASANDNDLITSASLRSKVSICPCFAQWVINTYWQGTNTYIVGTGQQRVLIDTGEGRPSWIKAIQAVLLSENATIASTLISHWHGDHVGGITQLRELYPAVKVHKHQPDDGQLNISDGEVFEVEGATLRAVYSPGHTQDHMALILEEEDAMFTADNVLGHGTAVFEDLSSYIASLKKMDTLFNGRAYPGHGDVIDDGRAKISEYIRHRQQREDQVLQVLRSPNLSVKVGSSEQKSGWASMEIVKVVYKDVPENLHLPAHGGVMQVLYKLQDEDKVVEDESSGTWRIPEKAAL